MNQKNLFVVIGVSAATALLASGLFFVLPFDKGISSSPEKGLMSSLMGKTQNFELPLKTPETSTRVLEYVLKNGTKEFHLSAEPIRWEYGEGKTILAWGYNGQVPGPEIRVKEGDRVRIVFANKLPKATTIHWHGVDVPNSQDGVPGLTQKAIEPGETFTYEFIAKPAGTHFYHTHGSSHSDEAQQLDLGLSGAFIIEPQDYVKSDKEYTLVLDEWQAAPMKNSSQPLLFLNLAFAHEINAPDHEGMMNMSFMGGGHSMDYNLFTINGRAFPYTEPLGVQAGDRVRLRVINAGSSAFHPMHLHGHQFKIVALDGNPVPLVAQLTRNTITLHPGETADIEFVANNPGVWIFHCHELHHADAGMIVPLVYEGFSMETHHQ